MNTKILFASPSLRDELKTHPKYKQGDVVVNFAYSDYGGDFYDIVCIDYFIESYPDNIVWESTHYFGRNAIVFGDPAERFIEETRNYPLGFEDLEEYYSNREHDVELEDFNLFIDDEFREASEEERETILQWLIQNKSGEYGITTQGLDFCSRDLVDELKEKGII